MELWQEMRRRRVFRVMGLYIVGAWLALQVGATLFPAWGIPDAGLHYLFVAAIVGFPIAIIFGWLFQITPEGIVRTLPVDQDDAVDYSLKRTDYGILAALGVLALIVVYGGFEKIAETTSEEQTAAERPPNSVAVIPFVNLDTSADTEYFSDGVTEEILHKLSKFQELHVLGYSSSFAFKDTDLTPQRVSEVLGVRYLLQGSIRREVDHVRVRASLVDQSGLQVWSASFDREMRGIFALQSEIANLVAKEMVAEIAPREIEPGSTTSSTEAYEAYLIGLDYLRSRTPRYANKAEEVFRQAVELDPDFAPAHAGLAMAIGLDSGSDLGEFAAILEDAQSHVARSLELVPDLAMGHAAQGLLLEYGQQADFVAAEKALRRALELDPTIVNAYNWLSIALRSQGRVDESLTVKEMALKIDPLNPIINANVATGYSDRGDFREAERQLLRLIDLPQPPGTVYVSLHQLYAQYGRYAKAVEWGQKRIRAYGGTADSWALSGLGNIFLDLGMDEEADYWIDRSIEADTQPVNGFFRNIYRLKMRGEYPQMIKLMDELNKKYSIDVSRLTVFAAEIVAAIYLLNEDYEAGIPIMEGVVSPDDPLKNVAGGSMVMLDFMHVLAYAYRQTGRDEEADILLEKCARHLEQLRTDFKAASPGFLELKVLNYAMRGDIKTAVRHFEEAVDSGWRKYRFIENDGRWAGFFDNPAVQSQLAFVRADLDRQREAIRASGADAEFRAEYDALIEAAD